jgi:hypothetical protein
MPTAEDMGTTMPGMAMITTTLMGTGMGTDMGTVGPLGVRPTWRRNGGRIATG